MQSPPWLPRAVQPSGVSHAGPHVQPECHPGHDEPRKGRQERDTSLRNASTEGAALTAEWYAGDPLLENSQEVRMTRRIGSTKQVPSGPAICITAVTYIENYNLPLLMMHSIYNPVISYPDPVEVLCSA